MTKEHLGSFLAFCNAVFNGMSLALLILGRVAIAKGQKTLHRVCMFSAFGVSVLFLASYLTRVYISGTHPFPGQGLGKAIYLSILFSHMILAATVPVLAITSMYFAYTKQFPRHQRWAKVAWPIWVYVSTTGILVYLMLYVR